MWTSNAQEWNKQKKNKQKLLLGYLWDSLPIIGYVFVTYLRLSNKVKFSNKITKSYVLYSGFGQLNNEF